MQLIKVWHEQVGTKLSAAGNIVKVFAHRVKVKCPACKKVYIRGSYASIKAKTCGCVPHKKHGGTAGGKRHPLYGRWKNMRNRCENKKNRSYQEYGGRGISVCPQWAEFAPFKEWALANGWKPGLMLDRKDNDGNYTPQNCRFTTFLESNRNRGFCITKEKALAIHALLAIKVPERQIANLMKVKRWTVRNIRRGLCWRKDQCLT